MMTEKVKNVTLGNREIRELIIKLWDKIPGVCTYSKDYDLFEEAIA